MPTIIFFIIHHTLQRKILLKLTFFGDFCALIAAIVVIWFIWCIVHLCQLTFAAKCIETSCDFKLLVKYDTVNLVMIKICLNLCRVKLSCLKKVQKTVLYFWFDVVCAGITFITWMMNKTKITKNTTLLSFDLFNELYLFISFVFLWWWVCLRWCLSCLAFIWLFISFAKLFAVTTVLLQILY